MHLEHRLRLGEGSISVTIARLNRDELYLRIALREALADVLDPLVLIRGAQAGSDDRELAALPHDARGAVGERVADALGRCLVDEEIARVALRIRVPCHDFDTSLTRLPEHRRDGLLVLDAHSDGVYAASDPRLDNFVLLRGIELGGTVPEELHAKLLRCAVRAEPRADEVWIPLCLWHQSDHGTIHPRGAIRAPAIRRGRRRGISRSRASKVFAQRSHE